MKSDQQRAERLFGKNEVLVVMEDGSGSPVSITTRKKIKWGNILLLAAAVWFPFLTIWYLWGIVDHIINYKHPQQILFIMLKLVFIPVWVYLTQHYWSRLKIAWQKSQQ